MIDLDEKIASYPLHLQPHIKGVLEACSMATSPRRYDWHRAMVTAIEAARDAAKARQGVIQ